MFQPNYEAIGRYHTVKARRKKLLDEITADGETVKQAAFVVSIHRPDVALHDTLTSAINRLECALSRIKDNAANAQQLLQHMQALKAEYQITD